MSGKNRNEKQYYSTNAAAPRLGTSPTALRRKLQRALDGSTDGMARLGVVIGRKFGRSWRVWFVDDESGVGAS